uniref:Uncharacterized protein n=1 Tax=Tanacetum cinerariifolium TaxID=118510 RepID=A0A699JKI0_TANCI|nr:hypothetical protein [Tanacetum cinerariifolium]
MMLLSCSPTHSSIQLALNSSVVTISSAPCTCSSMNFVQMTSHPVLVGKTCKFSVAGGNSYAKVRAINPRRNTSTTHGGNWEDPDGKTCKFSVAGGNSYAKVRAINPRRNTSTTHGGNWEDPDGSDSEMEEDEEGEEKNLDFESDWEEEETDASETSSNTQRLSASQIEEHLIKEVEELLTPEELAILQQNEAPFFDKISTK